MGCWANGLREQLSEDQWTLKKMTAGSGSRQWLEAVAIIEQHSVDFSQRHLNASVCGFAADWTILASTNIHRVKSHPPKVHSQQSARQRIPQYD